MCWRELNKVINICVNSEPISQLWRGLSNKWDIRTFKHGDCIKYEILYAKSNTNVFQPTHGPPFVNDDELSATYMARYLILNKKITGYLYDRNGAPTVFSLRLLIEQRVAGAAPDALLIIYCHLPTGQNQFICWNVKQKHIRVFITYCFQKIY